MDIVTPCVYDHELAIVNTCVCCEMCGHALINHSSECLNFDHIAISLSPSD